MITSIALLFFIFSIILLAVSMLAEKMDKYSNSGWIGILGIAMFGLSSIVLMFCTLAKIITWSLVHMP